MKRVLLFTLMAPVICFAGDLGQIGRTYEIREPDFEEVLRAKIAGLEKSGELEKIKTQIQQKAKDQVARPKPVSGLATVTKSRERHFDPSIVTTKPVTDQKGTIIAPIGTRVNPLDHVSLGKPLFLFNSDDPKQVELARTLLKKYGQMTLVLTGGNYIDTMKQLKTKVFFDQAAQLTRRFQITAVPSLITQDGKRLKIHEMAP